MNLGRLFGFGQSSGEPERNVNASPILTLANAEKFLQDARSCLNDKDGAQFVSGIKAGFVPLRDRVANEAGKALEYGDTLQEFAKLTRDNPEPILETLMLLASQMQHAPASGVRFIIAELILAYGSVGVYPHGSLIELVRLQEQSVQILEAGSRYG